MMPLILSFFILLPVSASTNWDIVQKQVLENLPKLISSEKKIEAQEGTVQSMQGQFDNKIKAKTQNRFENKYDNQFHDVQLSKQNKLLGSRLFLGHRQGTGLFPVYDQKYETTSVGEIYAGINLPLLRDLITDEYRTNYEVQRLELKIREQQWRMDAMEVLMQAFAKYTKWIETASKLKIYRDLYETAEQRQTLFEKRHKAGDIEKIKLSDNQRSLSKRKAELLNAELNWKNATLDLANYYPSAKQIDLKEIPDTSTLNLMANTNKTNKESLPQFEIIKFEKNQMEQKVRYYQSQALPELSLTVEGARDIGRHRFDRDPDQLRLGLQIEIPIENNKARGGITESRMKKKAIDYQLEWLNRLWDNQVNSLNNDIKISTDSLRELETVVENSEKMSNAERTRLKEGDGDLFVVNIREQDEAEARIKFLETKMSLQRSIYTRRLVGGELEIPYAADGKRH